MIRRFLATRDARSAVAASSGVGDTAPAALLPSPSPLSAAALVCSGRLTSFRGTANDKWTIDNANNTKPPGRKTEAWTLPERFIMFVMAVTAVDFVTGWSKRY
jgi:hypothetical protein